MKTSKPVYVHKYCCVCGKAYGYASQYEACPKCRPKITATKKQIQLLETRVQTDETRELRIKLLQSQKTYDTKTGFKIWYRQKEIETERQKVIVTN